MIYGIGTDIVQTSRIESSVKRHGDRFAEKILGVDELKIYHQRKASAEVRGLRFLATRFAAKEAFSKAIGLGITAPMNWSSVQILNLSSGQPIISTINDLSDWMKARGLTARVSISDETDYVVAFVIVEKNSDSDV